MTQYDETFTGLEVVNLPGRPDNTLGEYLSGLGMTQLRIAETQKYAHVTFFFNGGVEKPNPGEDRMLIPSPKVATFDLKPEMSAYEVASKAVQRDRLGKYDLMILNFANCDMVGHTGIMDAAMQGRARRGRLRGPAWCDAILQTAAAPSSPPTTATPTRWWTRKPANPSPRTPPTPCPSSPSAPEMIGKTLRAGGRLCDIAPTMLESMGIPVPKEMTGKSLFL